MKQGKKIEKFIQIFSRSSPTCIETSARDNRHRNKWDISPINYQLPFSPELPNRIASNRLEHRDRRAWSRDSPPSFPCSRVSRETLVEQLEASMERGWTVMRRPRDGSELLILGTVRIPAIRGDYQVGWYAPRRMWNPFFPLRSAILSSL